MPELTEPTRPWLYLVTSSATRLASSDEHALVRSQAPTSSIRALSATPPRLDAGGVRVPGEHHRGYQ
jgi:hypothetical protein